MMIKRVVESVATLFVYEREREKGGDREKGAESHSLSLSTHDGSTLE